MLNKNSQDMKGEYFMATEMMKEMEFEVIDTNVEIEEVGPGTPVCIPVCLAGCAATTGFGTLGSTVAGTALF